MIALPVPKNSKTEPQNLNLLAVDVVVGGVDPDLSVIGETEMSPGPRLAVELHHWRYQAETSSGSER